MEITSIVFGGDGQDNFSRVLTLSTSLFSTAMVYLGTRSGLDIF